MRSSLSPQPSLAPTSLPDRRHPAGAEDFS
jgi:hypothetical protein